MPSARPNIVYLHSHDTGRYIEPYGYGLRTPRLQRLAEGAVLFRNAFCINPTCSASRAALLTGTYPHINGMIGLAHRGSRLVDPRWHLASFLRDHGYATALAGVQHEIGGDARLLGYEHLLTERIGAVQDRDRAAAQTAARFIPAPHERPFFLSCGFFTTHRTGRGTQWFNGSASPTGDPRYVRPPAPLPDTPQTRQDFADYAVSARRLDDYMGTVLDALDAAGLADNTILICTTDHGIAFPFMKCNLTDHGTGVMLLIRAPGGCPGHVADALVTHLDVFPTLCELAGLPAPQRLQGASLLPLLSGQERPIHEAIFATLNYHAAYEPARSLRTARHRYIRRFDPRPHPILPNCDDSVSKDLMLSLGWRGRPQPREELYDLAWDPGESCNRAADPACAADMSAMRARLDQWMRHVADPLLAGPPPAPGLSLNDPAGISAQEPVKPADP